MRHPYLSEVMKLCHFLSVFVLLLFIGSCTENKSVYVAGNSGMHLFGKLKHFDPDRKQQFADGFISLKTIRRMGYDKTQMKSKGKQRYYSKMKESEYEKEITGFAYDLIYGEGDAFSIEWRDIEYVTFLYADHRHENMEAIKGLLVFEYKKRQYDVGCIYVMYDDVWQLAAVTSLTMRHKKDYVKPENEEHFVAV